ncbi:MAG: rhomboid family intramembrane serine protease [Thermoplasmata archaeon]|nr:rhomboid family intramembrane serine protease [Thermoplasmata archaeon]
MLEYVPIPAIIIASLIYAKWKNAYLTQVMVIANFFIFIYVLALNYIDQSLFYDMRDVFTFVPARFGDIAYLPSIITSMYMHADPFHLIGNVLILYLIGLPLEERIGSKNWGIIYFTTGIVATMMFYIFHPASTSFLLGASGAIYGIGGALLVLYPKDRIPMFIGPIFSTRAPVWLAVGTMFILSTFLVMMSIDDGVAHLAHFGGIVCGIFLAPMIVKDNEKKENAGIDIQLLREMAMTPDDILMVDKIEKETEPDIRDAWLEFFFQDAARCPNCRRKLKEFKPKITCECGKEIRPRR